MKFLRIALLMLGGATAMVLSLLWVAQFFNGPGDTVPVIRLQTPAGEAEETMEQASFIELQEDRREH